MTESSKFWLTLRKTASIMIMDILNLYKNVEREVSSIRTITGVSKYLV